MSNWCISLGIMIGLIMLSHCLYSYLLHYWCFQEEVHGANLSDLYLTLTNMYILRMSLILVL